VEERVLPVLVGPELIARAHVVVETAVIVLARAPVLRRRDRGIVRGLIFVLLARELKIAIVGAGGDVVAQLALSEADVCIRLPRALPRLVRVEPICDVGVERALGIALIEAVDVLRAIPLLSPLALLAAVDVPVLLRGHILRAV